MNQTEQRLKGKSKFMKEGTWTYMTWPYLPYLFIQFWTWRKDSLWLRLNWKSILNILSLILKINESELSVNPQEEEMRVNCKERLSKNQFDLTVRKDERFLLDLSLILKINDRSLSVNPQEESMRVNCKERLSKNQFDLTVRKDERFSVPRAGA